MFGLRYNRVLSIFAMGVVTLLLALAASATAANALKSKASVASHEKFVESEQSTSPVRSVKLVNYVGRVIDTPVQTENGDFLLQVDVSTDGTPGLGDIVEVIVSESATIELLQLAGKGESRRLTREEAFKQLDSELALVSLIGEFAANDLLEVRTLCIYN